MILQLKFDKNKKGEYRKQQLPTKDSRFPCWFIMQTISDEIGEDYREWKRGDRIFITAPTGTGKSYFILHKLLGYIIDRNSDRKVLYLVNRTILKNQIEYEIIVKVAPKMQNKLQYLQKNIEDFIEVRTYQSIERMLQENTFNGYANHLCNKFYQKFSYVVYDECHYFSVDSTFNTLTELSYDFLRNTFFHCVQIFLSATMQNIESQLINRREVANQNYSTINDNIAICMNNYTFSKNNIKKYTVTADYSNINIQVIEDKKSLNKIILANNQRKDEKWLIFTDNIEQGKELQKDLCPEIEENGNITQEDIEQEENVVFIDAKFNKDELAQKTVGEISSKNYSSAKIIISTCVMDNGISIKDENLRNLVIMADNEETFMQMLGRKRFINENDKTITIFILKRNKKYFNNRIMHIGKILNFYRYNKAYAEYPKYNYCFYYNCIYFNNCIYYQQDNDFNCQFKDYKRIFKQPYLMTYLGLKPDTSKLIQLAKNIIENVDITNSLIYSYGDGFHINSFAINRYKFLIGYYHEILEELECDDNAFIKRQLSWIGKDFNGDQINNLFSDEVKICQESLIKKINKVIGKELSKQENLDLKKDIKRDIDILLKIYKPDNENISKYIKYFSDKNSTISKDTFNNIMEILKLDYHMDSPTLGKYIINQK